MSFPNKVHPITSPGHPFFVDAATPRRTVTWKKLLGSILIASVSCATIILYASGIYTPTVFWEVGDLYATQHRVSSNTRNPAFLIKASRGAVASENELCSVIGVDTLKAGGNAVDAAVSTTLCIGVVNMFS